MEYKEVTYKIVTSKEWTEYTMPSDQALLQLKQYLNLNGGWFYINKVTTSIDTTTTEMLESAKMIAITNIIDGGRN